MSRGGFASGPTELKLHAELAVGQNEAVKEDVPRTVTERQAGDAAMKTDHAGGRICHARGLAITQGGLEDGEQGKNSGGHGLNFWAVQNLHLGSAQFRCVFSSEFDFRVKELLILGKGLKFWPGLCDKNVFWKPFFIPILGLLQI